MYREFLSALFSDILNKYILLWFYDGEKLKESYWFKSAGDAADFLDKHLPGHKVNVYVGVGLSGQDYGSDHRCLKKDIVGIGGLWLDIDFKDPVHKKTNLPADAVEAYKLFDELPVGCQPSAVIESGHGLQAWWIFREVWLFDDTTERADAEQLAKRFNYYFKDQAKALGWDIDSTFDLARVMRVPGTTNYKGDPVPVKLLNINESRFNPSEFEEWLPELPKDQADTPGAPLPQFELSADLQPPFDKFEAACEIEPRFKLSFDKQRKDFQDQSASTYDMSLARFACMFGWSDQEIVSLLVAFRRKHKEDPTKLLRVDYYQRTLIAAKKANNKQQASELLDTYTDSQEIDSKGITDPNQKEAILQALSARFDVRLIQIIKFMADPPTYKLKTSRGNITLGEVGELIGQGKLRTHIAAATGKLLPRFKPEQWDNIAQALLDCCMEVDVGEEATEEGAINSWLEAYLEANNRSARIS